MFYNATFTVQNGDLLAVRLSDLDLVNRNCSFRHLQYEDPHYPGTAREVLVVRGPTSFKKREAIFLHFSLEDETRDFYTVSYFVFPGFDAFNIRYEGYFRQKQMFRIFQYLPYLTLFIISYYNNLDHLLANVCVSYRRRCTIVD